MNNFLKKAYLNDKVHSLEDIFLEDEYYYINFDFIIKEATFDNNSSYQIGDIVFVRKYSYSDGYEGRNHLFVIVELNNLEYYGMLISSNIDKLKYNKNMMLKKNHFNNLICNSIIKTDVLYKISNKDIVFRVGKIKLKKIEEYKKMLLD